MGMLQRKDFLRILAMAMHCRAQELRCSTNVMLMSPASRVNLTARSSAKVQPLPPQPVVMASLQTAATFSRSALCLIFLMLGKICAILVTPYTAGSFAFMVVTSVSADISEVLKKFFLLFFSLLSRASPFLHTNRYSLEISCLSSCSAV